MKKKNYQEPNVEVIKQQSAPLLNDGIGSEPGMAGEFHGGWDDEDDLQAGSEPASAHEFRGLWDDKE